MKKTTRILALVLSLVLCMGLVACGGGTAPSAAPPATAPAATAAATAAPPASEAPTESEAPATDYDYIIGKGEMVIGYTDYAPMNYFDDSGKFTGFDTEFAEAVCAKLGVEPDFVEINWDTKGIELAAKSIDCIWNGMTINPGLLAEMSISLPYVLNAQVVVVKADSGYTSTADLIGKTVVAEAGSAGEVQLLGDAEHDVDPEENLAQAEYISMTKQTDCLLEVMAGTADACVLDWTLTKTMTGEGTDFAGLMMLPGLMLGDEEYGIAFRKGSDMTEQVNAIILELVADGTLPDLAEKYDLSLSPEIE